MAHFEGIGNTVATFALSGTLSGGQVCKIASSGTVSACDEDDSFHGVAVTIGDGICGVALSGLVTVAYSGTAPTVGYATLLADGDGGVAADEDGDTYLVVSVDTGSGTAVLCL